MTADFILAIDQGTTGTTALLFDHDGAVRERAYAEFTQHYPQPGWVEHDPEAIIDVTAEVVGSLLANSRIAADRIHAVGISNQRETVVLWDRDTGKPVAPAIVWQDRRTAKRCETIKSEGHENMIQRKTGLIVDPYFSATKLAWLLENDADLARRAARGDLAFGTIDSWLLARLTGDAGHVTDETNASRTLLYNIHDRAWDEELLALFNIPAACLPAVMPSAHVFGETDPAVLAGVRAPVAGVAGDQQAALFGHGCHRPGLAKNTYGTGSFLLLHTGKEAIASAEKLLATAACGAPDDSPQYALEGAIFTTGAAVQWLRDGLGIISEAAETESLAESLSGNAGVYFVPALAGLGAPFWDPYARGMFIGLTGGTSRAHVARAVLESIAYRTRDLTSAMARESGVPLTALRCDGGASDNRFLMQFQADLLGVPVEVAPLADVTALGAACLAGIASDFWDAGEAPFADRLPMRRYEPEMAQTERDSLYERWLAALARSRDWARCDTRQ